MARVFITGSSDGLGRMAAQLLIEQGHRVVLHARNERRSEEALAAVPGAETAEVLLARASGLAQCQALWVGDFLRERAGVDGSSPSAGQIPHWQRVYLRQRGARGKCSREIAKHKSGGPRQRVTHSQAQFALLSDS